MTLPADYSYTRYLAAKKTVDERALNRQVFEALARALRPRRDGSPLAFLEIGCGIGTMIERLWDWGILANARYLALDLDPDNISEALARVPAFFQERGGQVEQMREREWRITGPDLSITLSFEVVDVFDFMAREVGLGTFDVLVAHAFLDLVDLNRVLPGLLAFLKPEGWFYFTLNFDGATTLLPLLDPDLDALIERLYHGTMDERRVKGRPAGASRTGRLLFSVLPDAGGRVLAAGSSDWVVFPGPAGYPADETYFLHHIIHTVEQALQGQPLLEGSTLQDWASRRHRQIEGGELIYMAHQLDFFGVKEA